MTVKQKILNALEGLEMTDDWKSNLADVLIDVLKLK